MAVSRHAVTAKYEENVERVDGGDNVCRRMSVEDLIRRKDCTVC